MGRGIQDPLRQALLDDQLRTGKTTIFEHPTLGTTYLERALSYDSWLTWRHALTGDPEHWDKLNPVICANITRMAQDLHKMHESMPDYRRLCDSPFHVTRWWDPADRKEWRLGRSCIFRIGDYMAWELLQGMPRNSVTRLQKHTTRYVRADLSPDYHPSRPDPSRNDRSPRR